MARIRTVKPEFFRHEGLQDLERANPGKNVMLVFIGLWGHCDKGGKFEWRPRQLKLDILPFLDFDMESTLELLHSAGFLDRYDVDGKAYGRIPSFKDHQRIGGKEAQEPDRFPDSSQGNIREAPEKHLPAQEGKGREGKGALSDKSDFARWYQAYPRHEARGDAEKAWRGLKPMPALEVLLAAVEWQRSDGCLQPREADGRSLIPLPATWLRKARWLDERPVRRTADGIGTFSASELAP